MRERERERERETKMVFLKSNEIFNACKVLSLRKDIRAYKILIFYDLMVSNNEGIWVIL